MHNTTILKVKAQNYRTFKIIKFQYSMELHECNFLQLDFDQNKTSNNKSIRQKRNSRSFLSDNLCTFQINQSMRTWLGFILKEFLFFAHFNCRTHSSYYLSSSSFSVINFQFATDFFLVNKIANNNLTIQMIAMFSIWKKKTTKKILSSEFYNRRHHFAWCSLLECTTNTDRDRVSRI